ncbi:hypothetical protein [Actinacidiphila sp. ITFR-21]|uniref:hypothetical protein n=1 Tax=Actinacidiphila sp. ITFR-21 TaxID=3075199 RepID=UPI00288A1210|nr:hypothetical protein [Streptomyces sp. ITFR-21]WNI16652.1 hypothetical protein RLT57_14770 [Streptomyces sp. ITFR-21]
MNRDDLSRLVREANDAGVSYQTMADRAEAAGHPVSKPYLQKLATNQISAAPSTERLRGIAAALKLPLARVQKAAAAQYLQYETSELAGYSEDVRIVVAHLGAMSAADQRRWRAMIEAAEQADADGDPD